MAESTRILRPNRPSSVTRAQAESWMHSYGDLLCKGDVDAIAELFAVDAEWIPGPLSDPVVGREAIRAAYAKELAEAYVVEMVWSSPLYDGTGTAAAEWWVTMAEGPGEPLVSEPGALHFTLDPDGLCTSWRGYPFIAEWNRSVPAGWPTSFQRSGE